MARNVMEWVEDCNHRDYLGAPVDGSAWTNTGNCNARIWRGGGAPSGISGLRSANTGAKTKTYRGFFTGFRVARTLSQ